ncbi:hypothetical protein [Methylibium sp.]|uniref:hypothetical protein n=1 Tax=Methylibium sp. TaxID=2067992 RepID=UPI003BA9426E
MKAALLGAIAGSGGVQPTPEVDAWLVRVAAASGTVSAGTEAAARAFVVSCKTAGVWTLIQRLNLFCGNFAAMVIPLVNTVGNAADTFVNGVGGDYSESLGPQTDGSTKRIGIGYIPSELTGGMSFYLRTTQASDTTGRCAMGVDSAGSTQSYRLIGNRDGSGGTVAGAVRGAWGGPGATVGPATTGGMVAGLWHVVRRAPTDAELFLNGASVGTSSASATPASAGQSLGVFCLNNGGSFTSFLTSGTRSGAYAIDSGMTAPQAASFYTAMQAFQTALSRQA